MKLKFEFPVKAKAKERPRFSRKDKHVRTYTSDATRSYEHTIGMIAKAHMQGSRPLNGQLIAEVCFAIRKPPTTILACPKQDIDNFLKALFDALNGIAYQDDNQISEVIAKKKWSDRDLITLSLSPIPLGIEDSVS